MKNMFKNLFLKWEDWVDIDLQYNSTKYHTELTQMSTASNGAKRFRTVNVSQYTIVKNLNKIENND